VKQNKHPPQEGKTGELVKQCVKANCTALGVVFIDDKKDDKKRPEAASKKRKATTVEPDELQSNRQALAQLVDEQLPVERERVAEVLGQVRNNPSLPYIKLLLFVHFIPQSHAITCNTQSAILI
jgi:hypothetical protein